MKLSASNIGWRAEEDAAVYRLLQSLGFAGVEAAPTRISPDSPYDHPEAAAAFARSLQAQHGFAVPSMQSIWFGRSEQIFGAAEERQALLEYTRAAVEFAAAAGCPSLVFGCPKNRSVPEGGRPEDAAPFFRDAGRYAAKRGVVLALEANPPLYHTNFLNRTEDAVAYARFLDCPGIAVNLDVGTMLQNGEGLQAAADGLELVSHVHISEPGLAPVRLRPLHRQLAALLRDRGYRGFVSLETKTTDAAAIGRMAEQLAEVFA